MIKERNFLIYYCRIFVNMYYVVIIFWKTLTYLNIPTMKIYDYLTMKYNLLQYIYFNYYWYIYNNNNINEKKKMKKKIIK